MRLSGTLKKLLILLPLMAFGCQPDASSEVSSGSGLPEVAPAAAVSSSTENRSLAGSPVPPGSPPDGMAWIPGGTFQMGASDPVHPDESPVHSVTLSGYWMDCTEVTNHQFKEFVDATGYKTIAEKTPRREDFIGQVPDISAIPAENLVAGSICFNSGFDPKTLRKDHPLWAYQVWRYVRGASWKAPEGEGSDLEGRWDHPVVHVAWDDAQAYCRWKQRRLPTEAEWEFAARGNQPGREYPWGSELKAQGKWQNNIWQGEFPLKNSNDDGFATTSPVMSFPANPFGLYDMSGNVWEWCYDWYQPDYYQKSPSDNPVGPTESYDPQEPTIPKRVQRGGSFMCSDNYCTGYRVAARMKGDPSSGAFHTGFRTVVTPDMLATVKSAP